MNAAYLYAQLENADLITQDRMNSWNTYYKELKEFEEAGRICLPHIPDTCEHNAHMFYLKLRDLDDRTAFIRHLAHNDIKAVFHYIPLHSAPAGKRYGEFNGKDVYTTRESERLVRLPLYYGLGDDIYKVIECAREFLGGYR